MVVGWLFSQMGQLRFGESKQPDFEQAKPPEESNVSTAESFLKSQEAKKLADKWKAKGFTKRGISQLLRVLWLFRKSDKDALKEGDGILSALKGEDGLGKILGVLKLATEGLMRMKK